MATQKESAPAFVPAPTVTTNVLAIVSLVTGIAGLTFVPFLGSIAAVVTGHISLHQLKAKPEQGRGMALAGLITGYVGVGLAVLGTIAMIAFFVLLMQSGYANNGVNHNMPMPMRGFSS
jgi:hypothetical protein